MKAIFAGFWLGILTKENLHLIDQVYYDKSKMYGTETYNKSGLWDWEKRVFDKYFQSCKTLLVAGVGGGREVLALRELGYETDGFECNPGLAEFANYLLRSEGFDPNIELAKRDDCPDSQRYYGGIVVGWGAYMLIQGKGRRIDFLKKLRSQTRLESPILLSFFYRSGNRRYYKIVATVGNRFRWLLRRDYLELGDDLTQNYVHFFTQEEIASELNAGGFELVMYSIEHYGHAVGVAY
ncbi:MAG: hypothetical protein MUO26_14685 [Methanotrichaceae archaeon]|nr:hypothetical protein [Methanotrichaceae archaeon]